MADKTNIIECLNTLTTIESSVLNKLVELSRCVMVDSVLENINKSVETTEIDIGVGTLLINTSDDTLRFRFIPNAKFEEDLKRAYKDKINPLDSRVENALKNKIINVYKDLL